MSQPPHVVHLPLAEEVEHAPYELRSLKAPVLRGLALDLFLSIYESSLGYYLYPILGRQSGVNQASMGAQGLLPFIATQLTCSLFACTSAGRHARDL